MEQNQIENIHPLVFAFFGVLLGTIGNFMVASVYRIVDELCPSSLNIDIVTFCGSTAVIIWLSYKIMKMLPSKKRE